MIKKLAYLIISLSLIFQICYQVHICLWGSDFVNVTNVENLGYINRLDLEKMNIEE